LRLFILRLLGLLSLFGLLVLLWLPRTHLRTGRSVTV
jgi:hypothetical protein